MYRITRLFRRVLFFFKRDRFDRDLAEEIQFHLELKTQQNIQSGMSENDARYAAIRHFGNAARTGERSREIWMFHTIEILVQDIRYALRVLVKNPAFTFVAVIALALGIGANSAIFSVVNAVLLRPLPYRQPDRLVAIQTFDVATRSSYSQSYPNFRDLKTDTSVFDSMAAYTVNHYTLTDESDPVHLLGAVVSIDLFNLLGTPPMIGRTFLPAEDQPGNSAGIPPVVLSNALWQSKYRGDAGVIGRIITLDDKKYNVIGVMSPTFDFPIQSTPVQLWTTISYWAVKDSDDDSPITEERGYSTFNLVGRLKNNFDIRQAQANVDSVWSGLVTQYPDDNAKKGVTVTSLHDSLVGDVRSSLLILLATVGCVLLIACANVANLLLARATTRHREIAIRSALGASRSRVIRQLMTESVILALLGGGVGLLFGIWAIQLVIKFGPENIPRVGQSGLDRWVFVFTAGVSVLTGLIFGLVPAIQTSRTDLTESLKDGGRGVSSGWKHNRMRSILMVSEVAIATILLIGAAILIQSLVRLQNVNPGFDSRGVITLRVDPPDARYPAEQKTLFYNQLIERVRALPGVRSASATSQLPLAGSSMGLRFEIEGRPVAIENRYRADFRISTPGYFQTLHIPVLKGRDFNDQDTLKSPEVVIVNEAFAKQYFPDQDPIGKRVIPSISVTDEPPMRQIVGVVGDVKFSKLNIEAAPEIYTPYAQIPFIGMALVVRTDGEPMQLVSSLRNELRSIDKDLPFYDIKLMDQYFSKSIAPSRFNSFLLGVFAAMAMILASVGLYGVLAYTVTQRTHEIGIRLALGADAKKIFRLVIGQGMLLVLIGIATGEIAAFVSTGVLSRLVFNIGTHDPTSFIASGVTLTAVALLACFIPAWRAARVDPMVALRYD